MKTLTRLRGNSFLRFTKTNQKRYVLTESVHIGMAADSFLCSTLPVDVRLARVGLASRRSRALFENCACLSTG